MYRHILIPTDGSELAERGVTHGLALAKSLGRQGIRHLRCGAVFRTDRTDA
ncbi:universal stress protein [Bradyrhizobium sp. BWA-3-5]|uniref:universal stress protein n=1 Tax=Bradyrhizobium sp. BWA-3-5 TaxID=3080013 RepID=UPI0039780CA8